MKFTPEQKQVMRSKNGLCIDGRRYRYRTKEQKQIDQKYPYICGSWFCTWEGMKDELSTGSEDKLVGGDYNCLACPKCGNIYMERPQEYYDELGENSHTMKTLHTIKTQFKERLKRGER